MYSGPKAALRPLHDLLVGTARSLGPDVEIAPKKATVSLRRTKQFGLITPATRDRIDLGLNLPGNPGAGRLTVTTGMCTHKVGVRSPDEVDDELVDWLRQAYDRAGVTLGNDRVLQQIAIATTALIFVQIVAGATMRHNEAGLAIPDFPLAFGQIIPPHWDLKIALHFAHRVGALIVTLLVLATTGHVFYHHRRRPELVRPAALLLVLLAVQITLGALTVLSGRDHIINSLHVVTGALVLVTSLVVTLRAHRGRFATVGEPSLSPPAQTFTVRVAGHERPPRPA